MARNLQSKLPPSDTVRIYDINRGAAEKLAQEMSAQQAGGASVQVVDSAADASREAVRGTRPLLLHPFPKSFYDEFVPNSMSFSKLGPAFCCGFEVIIVIQHKPIL